MCCLLFAGCLPGRAPSCEQQRETMRRSAITVALLCGLLPFCACKPRQPQVDDKMIVEQIEAKLFQDPALKLRDIHVESHQGQVTLSGRVRTESEKGKVEGLAREVNGVTRVVNSLDYPRHPHASGGTTSEGTAPPAPAQGGGAGSAGNPQPPGGESAAGAGGGTPGGAPTWTDPIDQYLARKPTPTHSSPLTGQGSTFESYGQQYSVDPRLIVAITAAETTFATAKCHSTPVVETHNAWNWFWCYGKGTCGDDVCGNSSFDAWGSGIGTVSKFMRKNYINKGYTTVPLIRSKYCTSGCDNWIPNVTHSLEEMNGDPNNLTLGGGP